MTASSVGKRIKQAREGKQFTQQDVGKFLGISRAAVAQWESDVTSPSLATVAEVSKFLETRPEWLAYGIDTKTNVVFKAKEGLTGVQEVMFGDRPDQRIIAREWDLPADYLRGELRSSDTFIWSVDGSSLPAFEHGDKLIVDGAAKKPSPSGTFLLWDGVGPALAQVSVIPRDGKLVARVSTDGTTTSYEVAPEKLTVLGRVRGVVKNV